MVAGESGLLWLWVAWSFMQLLSHNAKLSTPQHHHPDRARGEILLLECFDAVNRAGCMLLICAAQRLAEGANSRVDEWHCSMARQEQCVRLQVNVGQPRFYEGGHAGGAPRKDLAMPGLQEAHSRTRRVYANGSLEVAFCHARILPGWRLCLTIDSRADLAIQLCSSLCAIASS